MTNSQKNPIVRPTNFASRPAQYRLLLYVGALMLVVIMMNEAGKAKNWAWMWNFQNPDAANPSASPQQPMDTKLSSQDRSSSYGPADSFVARAVSRPEEVVSLDGKVNPSLLSIVQDDTFFRAEEHVAWFHLFNILEQSSNRELVEQTLGKIGYNQLFQQTAEYRGKIVEIDGTVRRAHWLKAPRNDIGLQGYWQCFMNCNDGSRSPVVVYAVSMPEEFPAGMDLREEVSFIGFCYKRWAYQASDVPRLAPVILAKTGDWHRKVIQPVRKITHTQLLTLITITCGCGVTIALLVYVTAAWKSQRSKAAEERNVKEFENENRHRRLPTVSDSLQDLESNTDV